MKGEEGDPGNNGGPGPIGYTGGPGNPGIRGKLNRYQVLFFFRSCQSDVVYCHVRPHVHCYYYNLYYAHKTIRHIYT